MSIHLADGMGTTSNGAAYYILGRKSALGLSYDNTQKHRPNYVGKESEPLPFHIDVEFKFKDNIYQMRLAVNFWMIFHLFISLAFEQKPNSNSGEKMNKCAKKNTFRRALNESDSSFE